MNNTQNNLWYCDMKNWQCRPSDEKHRGEFINEQDCWRGCNNLGNIAKNTDDLFQTQILPYLNFKEINNLFQTNRGFNEFTSQLDNFYIDDNKTNLITPTNQYYWIIQKKLELLRFTMKKLNSEKMSNSDLMIIIPGIIRDFENFLTIINDPNNSNYADINLLTPQVLKLFIDFFIALYRVQTQTLTPSSLKLDIINALTSIYHVIHDIIKHSIVEADTDENYEDLKKKYSYVNFDTLQLLYRNILNISNIKNYYYLKNFVFRMFPLILDDLYNLTYISSSKLDRRRTNILQWLIIMDSINKMIFTNLNSQYSQSQYKDSELKIFALIFDICSIYIEHHLYWINQSDIEKKNTQKYFPSINREVWDSMSFLVMSGYANSTKLLEFLYLDNGFSFQQDGKEIKAERTTFITTDDLKSPIPIEFNIGEITNNLNRMIISDNIKNFWLNFIIYSSFIFYTREDWPATTGIKILNERFTHDINYIKDFTSGGSPFSMSFQNNFDKFRQWFQIFTDSIIFFQEEEDGVENNIDDHLDINANILYQKEFLTNILNEFIIQNRERDLKPSHLFNENMIIKVTSILLDDIMDEND